MSTEGNIGQARRLLGATVLARSRARRLHRHQLRRRQGHASSPSSSSTSPAAPTRRRPRSAPTSPNGKYTISFEFLPAEADAQREQLVRRLGAEDDSIDIIGMDVIWTAEFANAGWIEPWTGAAREDR